jgi:methionine-rich copper-binding protein CopC
VKAVDCALGVALLLGVATQADAHAHLESASPAVGSTAVAAPAQLVLHFSEGLELAFSGATVTRRDRMPVAIGGARFADKDSTLIVPILATLGAGQVTVDWHALSHDGHATRGSYVFTVQP